MTDLPESVPNHPTWPERLQAKRTVLLLVLVGAAVLLVSGSRVWVEGTTADTGLGASFVRGTGSQVARGVVGAALVGAAAAVAAATGGRVVRIIAATATMFAGVLSAVLVVSLVLDPGVALGDLAAGQSALHGSVPVDATVTSWPWIALVASLAMVLGAVTALVGGRRWSGLSVRYDAPGGGAAPGDGTDPSGQASAARGGRGRPPSDWDRLSQGEDPTTPTTPTTPDDPPLPDTERPA